MKDEIKKILDRLDFNEWEVDLYQVPITWCELYTIRDYITNLEEENKNLKDFNTKLQATKDRLDKYDKENQLRIDKAIEYLKEPNRDNFDYSKARLLEILQGESND